MKAQQETLERLLDEWLRRESMRHPLRYEVRQVGELWAIVDCQQNQERGGKLVRRTRWRAIAQSACVFGNALGQCQALGCDQPATVMCFGQNVCIEHVPPGEGYGLIPLDVLRLWRASEYRCGG
jgi:hypothetical protein